MNKKSNFTRTVLLGALLCGIAGPSFVGCKDYDDDIENLQVQIDQNKDAIAKLQELVNGGAIVTSVESDGNGGVIITLSDGSTHNITKGEKGDKGDKGDQGDQGLQGLPGDPGAPGAVPTFKIENGELMYTFESGETAQWESLGKVVAEAPVVDFEYDETTGELLLNGESLGVVKGDKGDQGDPGTPGQPGQPGDPGTPGAAPVLNFEIKDGHLFYSVNGGEPVDLGQVKGEKGDQGDPGTPGAPGTPGTTPVIPAISFSYDAEQGLMFQVGTEEAAPIAGFNEALTNLIAESFSLTVNTEGWLCVNNAATEVFVGYNITIVEGKDCIQLTVPTRVEGEGDAVSYSYTTVTLPTTDIFGKVITSVNFVPLTGSRELSMYQVSVVDEENKVVANKYVRATPSELAFRVNPSTAQWGEDKDFVVMPNMDWFLTRSQEPRFFAERIDKNEDGLLYVNFSFNDEVKLGEKYTLALALEDMHNPGRVVYSDYITFNAEEQPLDIVLAEKNDKGELVAFDMSREMAWDVNASCDLSKLIVATNVEGQLQELSNFGFNSIVDIEFVGDETQEGFLHLDENNVLTITPNFVNLDKPMTFDVKITIDGQLVYTTTEGDQLTVTASEEEGEKVTETFDLVTDITVANFIGETNPMGGEPIYLTINQTEWVRLQNFFMNEMDVDFTVSVKDEAGEDATADFEISKNLTPAEGPYVRVQSSADAGIYTVVMTYTNATEELTANVEFTINLDAPVLTPAPGSWQGNNLIVVDDENAGILSGNLTTAFAPIEGTKVVFEVDAEYADYAVISADGSTISLTDKNEGNGGKDKVEMNGTFSVPVSYELQNATTGAVLQSGECNVVFYNPIRSYSLTTANVTYEGTAIDLIEASGFNMMVLDQSSRQNKYIVRNGEVFTEKSELETDELNAAPYGVTAESFSFKSSDSRLTFNESGEAVWNGALAEAVVVEVTVTVSNNWADIVVEDTIYVTIEPNI